MKKRVLQEIILVLGFAQECKHWEGGQSAALLEAPTSAGHLTAPAERLLRASELCTGDTVVRVLPVGGLWDGV